MANPEHVAKLQKGVRGWNRWRKKNPDLTPVLNEAYLSAKDLSGADLSRADLSGSNLGRAILCEAYLSEANLSRAYLSEANLSHAYLSGANLSRAILSKASLICTNLSGADLNGAALGWADIQNGNLSGANLRQADLRGANLTSVNMSRADLRGAMLGGTNLTQSVLRSADLTGAFLQNAVLVHTDFENAVLSGCSVYGISAWDLHLEGAIQSSLVITPKDQPQIHVDDLEVAQFIYLLLNRKKLRNVITTLGEKAVLVLGRFTERKELLDQMADKLRSLGYLPMIFDFDRPTDRDLTETVKILAGLSRFVIADITNPRSVSLELQATIPDYMVPFVTILQRGQPTFGMFDDLPSKYHWALPLLEYNSADTLLATFEQRVVNPALDKAQEVRIKKAEAPIRRSAED